ncbi:MAG: MazG nucleotide pyrophosphohydrolase domain-containing protein [Candidatus Bipolaricaulota bacterium]
MPISQDPKLSEVQCYVAGMERERGFADQSGRDKCLLLGEEVGELYRAVRRAEGLAVDRTSREASIGEELADLLIYLAAIANRYGVDLGDALRDKEEQNAQRAWERRD